MITIIYLVLMTILFIYTYIKYDKEKKSNFDHYYNREFVGEYGVEVLDYLMHKKITDRAFIASLINMISKKNIAFKRLKDDYEFTLIDKSNLAYSEAKLCEILFEKIGDDNKFTILGLKRYLKNESTCNVFTSHYDSWKTFVTFEAEKEQFFKNGFNANKKLETTFLAINILLFMILAQANIILSSISCIVGISYLLYYFSFSKRTSKGVEHYVKWMGFKNYLTDFGNFEDKDINEHVLWEKYLAYAIIFDINKQVSETLGLAELEGILEALQLSLDHSNDVEMVLEFLLYYDL